MWESERRGVGDQSSLRTRSLAEEPKKRETLIERLQREASAKAEQVRSKFEELHGRLERDREDALESASRDAKAEKLLRDAQAKRGDVFDSFAARAAEKAAARAADLERLHEKITAERERIYAAGAARSAERAAKLDELDAKVTSERERILKVRFSKGESQGRVGFRVEHW